MVGKQDLMCVIFNKLTLQDSNYLLAIICCFMFHYFDISKFIENKGLQFKKRMVFRTCIFPVDVLKFIVHGIVPIILAPMLPVVYNFPKSTCNIFYIISVHNGMQGDTDPPWFVLKVPSVNSIHYP